MKKLTLLSLFTIISFAALAQVTSLSEDFNTSCALPSSFPTDLSWSEYNPISSTIPSGEWGCTATNGRPTTSGSPTAGMECTGVWSSGYHLDTSYLVTPLLEIQSSDYPDSIYLQFDSKTTSIVFGGKLALLLTPVDSPSIDSQYSTSSADIDLTDSLNPIIGTADSTGWVTHQVSLSSYKNTTFYLAFRYSSPTATGNIWYLDNINLTSTALNVPHINKEVLPLTVIGNSTSSQITLSYTAPEAASYHIVMYDMVGRKVYDGQLMARGGTASYVINGLEFHPGMYCIKMGNENIYGTVKVIIQ